MAAPRPRSFSLVLLCILLADRGAASSVFTPNCTLPPPGTNYVAGVNLRSTLTILWNCLSIILLCTWNIQHLNVPAIRPPEGGRPRETWQPILDAKTKLKWMVFTVFIPEFQVGKALGEWRAARDYRSRKSHWIYNLPESWKMVHAYMANMGYFVLDWGDLWTSPPSGEGAKKETDGNAKAEFHGMLEAEVTRLLNDPGSNLSESARINLSRLKLPKWALTAAQWDIVLGWRIADAPDIPDSQLKKLDRGGTLVKALALLQVIYLILQLIARKVGGLPSAQLEIAALAFAASSGITYLLYWNRPQSVETVHYIKAKRTIQDQDLRGMLKGLVQNGPTYIWLAHRTRCEVYPEFGPAPIPNDAGHAIESSLPGQKILGSNYEMYSLILGALFGGTIFGALHCLAWNFYFPTPGEALAWKVCSVATTCLPLLSILPISAWMRLNPWAMAKKGSPVSRLIVGAIGMGLFLIPYVLARLFLLMEIFRSLFFLPPRAFIDTWSGSFPNWG